MIRAFRGHVDCCRFNKTGLRIFNYFYLLLGSTGSLFIRFFCVVLTYPTIVIVETETDFTTMFNTVFFFFFHKSCRRISGVVMFKVIHYVI